MSTALCACGCGALVVRVRSGGQIRRYASDSCRYRAERARRAARASEGRSARPRDHDDPCRPTGVDYMARAEAQLYPGRRYHTLTAEERAHAYERACQLQQADRAAGVFLDPMARSHKSDVRHMERRRETRRSA